MTLWGPLVTPARPQGRFSTWQGDGFREETWGSLARQAERAAVGLRRLGVEPRTRVATVLVNRFDAVAGLLGVWMNGGIVLSLPTPARGVPLERYAEQLRELCRSAGAELLLLDDAFAGAMADEDSPSVVAFGSLAADGAVDLRLPGPDEDAFVQFSSGSTSSPKGCVLTPRAIEAQIGMLRDRMEVSDVDDSGYSWLPISHDMGLFGGLMIPWLANGGCTLGDPLRFMRSPRSWLEDAAARGDTVTVSPNFGVELATRVARRITLSEPLRLRTWIVGSDPIEARAVEEAERVLRPLGLAASSFTPAYGMAETTLAVTMKRRGAPVTVKAIDLDAFHDGRVAAANGGPAMQVVSAGPPVRDTAVRIDGDADVGEIVVHSASLARGYLDDPGRTVAAFTPDGELRTGDLGFLDAGELYVVGREDDMIAVNGRNIAALEIESRVGRDERLKDGSSVLIEVHRDGRRRLVMLSEPAHNKVDFVATARAVRQVATSTAGIGLDECIFVRRGSLPKSPSGKIQRFRCRQLATAEGGVLARVQLG